MKTTAKNVTVHTERTFAIARSSTDSFERVIFEVEENGVVGLGEAAPTNYYGQTANDVAEALETAEIPDPWDIEGALNVNSHLPSTALAALDNALYDLAAKRLGVPLHKLLGLAKPETQSAFTLGIAEPEETVAEARRLSSFPILKMKVGSWRDIETVKAVAEFSDAELWVDANEAFTPDEAVEAAISLREAGVAMIEQPIPASAGPIAMRRALEAAHPVPLIADESSLTAADVPKLAGCVTGVNVKLAKCGGVRNALKMIHTARAHGMLAMLGCMVETSVGVSAASHIAGLFDFVDLDGAMLLADDPYSGPTYENGRITLTDEPGLGVKPR